MKTVGIMPLKAVRKLAADFVANAPKLANITIRESSSTLVVESPQRVILRAVWVKKSQCHVMAVEGSVIVS